MAGVVDSDRPLLPDQRLIRRRAVTGRYLRLNRLDANPASTDLSLNPSSRSYGSLKST